MTTLNPQAMGAAGFLLAVNLSRVLVAKGLLTRDEVFDVVSEIANEIAPDEPHNREAVKAAFRHVFPQWQG